MSCLHLFLFKRDLRFHDNPALTKACSRFFEDPDPQKKMLLFYCDPQQDFQKGTYSDFHLRFLKDSVRDLNSQLQKAGLPTKVFWLSMNRIEVLKKLLKKNQISCLFSTEESGNKSTFEADLRLQAFAKEMKVPWLEIPQYSILRGSRLKNHPQDWQSHWESFYRHTKPCPNVLQIFKDVSFVNENDLQDWGLSHEDMSRSGLASSESESLLQSGGETQALKRMDEFFKVHAKDYFKSISKPKLAEVHGSRLSTYLAWGNLSLRSLVQRLHKEQNQNLYARRSLQAFESRLHWRDHFMQRFEQNPRIETENLNPLFNQIRSESNPELHQKFFAGETGYPLIDAVMRCLNQTGFVNFRSRAMLTSFYTHHLWLPWPDLAKDLSKIFLDYEPGIHYCQLQMQAGTMGLHTMRIYNPSLQAEEKDEGGDFIRKWVPELKGLPGPLIAKPWDLTPFEEISYGLRVGQNYPERVVFTEETGRKARDVLWGLKNSSENEKFHRQFRGHEKQLRKIGRD